MTRRSHDARTRRPGSYKARAKRFSKDDWIVATTALALVVAEGDAAFTIGRTVERNLRLLPLRYATARHLVLLWRGSPGRAVSLERALQKHACRRYGERVANTNRGGGRKAPDGPHVLYVAVWGDERPSATSVESVGGRRVRFGVRDRRSACGPKRAARKQTARVRIGFAAA